MLLFFFFRRSGVNGAGVNILKELWGNIDWPKWKKTDERQTNRQTERKREGGVKAKTRAFHSLRFFMILIFLFVLDV